MNLTIIEQEKINILIGMVRALKVQLVQMEDIIKELKGGKA